MRSSIDGISISFATRRPFQPSGMELASTCQGEPPAEPWKDSAARFFAASRSARLEPFRFFFCSAEGGGASTRFDGNVPLASPSRPVNQPCPGRSLRSSMVSPRAKCRSSAEAPAASFQSCSAFTVRGAGAAARLQSRQSRHHAALAALWRIFRPAGSALAQAV